MSCIILWGYQLTGKDDKYWSNYYDRYDRIIPSANCVKARG